MSTFEEPRFDGRPLEVRQSGDEVAIYGTRAGLGRLVDLLEKLRATKTQTGSAHVHLEDYELLTEKSLSLTLVVIEDSRPAVPE